MDENYSDKGHEVSIMYTGVGSSYDGMIGCEYWLYDRELCKEYLCHSSDVSVYGLVTEDRCNSIDLNRDHYYWVYEVLI